MNVSAWVRKLVGRRKIGRIPWVPLGHFYSPMPSVEELKTREREIFETVPEEIQGVDLNTKAQLKLLEEFKTYYPELPFPENKQKGFRYYFENLSYSYSDAIFLYSMIRHLSPQRIIEVGSGFSSCVILDTNQLFFDNRIDCTFVDPYPELMRSLIWDTDDVHIIEKKLQDVDVSLFSGLSGRDIFFIDSTHVSKTGSDVNHIFFHILPALEADVSIHFHDIIYPFEYPREWVYEGRAWNEAYMLRAFLQHNRSFEIQFFNTYLEHLYPEIFRREFPLCLRNFGGSIWLRKL